MRASSGLAAMTAAAFLLLPNLCASAAAPAPDLTEPAARRVEAINRLIALDDWPAALTAAEQLLQVAPPDSYDATLGRLYRAQVILARDDGHAVGAIPDLEAVLSTNFWPREQMLEWQYILAQLYAQDDRPREAADLVEAWLAETSAPIPAAYVLYGVSELQLAQERSATSGKAARLEQVLRKIDAGLRLGVEPDHTLLYLKAVCLQQLQRWDEAAETLEFLLGRDPSSAERWTRLHQYYVNGDRELAALLAIERGREHGALDTAQSDLVRGYLLQNLGQARLALAAVEAGLQRGLEQPGPHWLYAAYLAYTIDEWDRAMGLLTRAERRELSSAQQHLADSLRAAIASARGVIE